MLQLANLVYIIPPLSMLIAGVAIGILLRMPAKRYSAGLISAFFVSAISSGTALWFVANAEYQYLTNIPLFAGFSQIINNTQYSRLVMGDLGKTTIATLVGLYELGLVLGFATLSEQKLPKKVIATTVTHEETPKKIALLVQKGTNGASVVVPESIQNGMASQAVSNSISILDRDERTIAELFLFGNTTKVIPKVDLSMPDGYYFEGIPSMKMETGRLRRVLDSLVGKNILAAELADKLVQCKQCGSPNLQLRSVCPECKSMTLTKHTVLEHFSCGLIEKQEAFRTPSGELVCPKCNSKLHLIGSDYRNLSQMYICSECGSLNKDLLQMMKCGGCGAVSQVGEETEEYLYTYTLNSSARDFIGDQIKPIEHCSNWFKSLGYVVVAPAFVSGRSGTRHTFDMLVLDSGSKSVDSENPKALHGTVIEILVSSKLIELADITRVYGKVCDVDCNSLIFAIPGLTGEAHHYAEQFKMRAFEGSSVEEAIKKSHFAPMVTSNPSELL